MYNRRVTLRDIAEDVGVTVATASMALRAHPRISPQTRTKVTEAAVRLGYIYNRAAANLRQTQSSLIAVCLSDASNPVFNEFLIHVEAELRGQGRQVFLGIARDELTLQSQFLQTAMEQGVGGIVLIPVRGTTRAHLRPVWPDERAEPLVPTVLISRGLEGLNLPQVLNDDRRAGTMAAECLIAHGHQRIIWVGGGQDTSTARDRQAGAAQAIAQAGLPAMEVLHGPTLRRFGLDAAQAILKRSDPAGRHTAAICFSDLIAFGMVAGILRSGTTPAESLSVIGCDDMEEAELIHPPLTTIAVNKEGIGRLGAQHAITRPGASVVTRLPPRLILRATVGQVAG